MWRASGSSRRRNAVLLWGIAVLAVVAAIGAGNAIRRPARPIMELSPTRLDLGEGEPNELVRGAFHVRNPGNRPLEISVRATCGCTELTPRVATVEPGGEQEIKLSVQLPDYPGSERSIRVIVQGNDPHRRLEGCSVIANSPASLRVSPSRIDFGKLSEGNHNAPAKSVTVCRRGGETFADLKMLEIRSCPGFLKVSKRFNEAGDAELEIALLGDVPDGDFYGAIEVAEVSAKYGTKVTVRGERAISFVVVPSTVFLRSDGDEGEPTTVDVIVVHQKSEGKVAVRLVNSPAHVAIAECCRIDDTRSRVRFAFDGLDEYASELDLSLAIDGTDGVVPVKFVNRPSQ